jgi:hypothetical protein
MSTRELRSLPALLTYYAYLQRLLFDFLGRLSPPFPPLLPLPFCRQGAGRNGVYITRLAVCNRGSAFAIPSFLF